MCTFWRHVQFWVAGRLTRPSHLLHCLLVPNKRLSNHKLLDKLLAHGQYVPVLVFYLISGGEETHASVTPVALFTGTKLALAPGPGLDPRSFLLSWPFGTVGGLDSALPWLILPTFCWHGGRNQEKHQKASELSKCCLKLKFCLWA